MKTRIALTIGFFVLVGCSDQGTSIDHLDASTGKPTYQSGEPISIVISNQTTAPLWFPHCNFQIGFYIERLQNGNWVDAGNIGVVCLAIYPAGMKQLKPGDINSETFFVNQAGTYRLKFTFARLSGYTELENFYSNTFIVQ